MGMPGSRTPQRRKYARGARATVATFVPRPRKIFRAFRWLFATAVLVSLCLALGETAWAAPFDLGDAGWEGAKGLVDLARTELGDTRVIATGKLDWSTLTPEDGVLLLHPERTVDPEELAAFLKAGGRVAVLDDFGQGDRILERYRIERTAAPAHPVLALRDNPALAIAEPVTELVAGRTAGVHPVVAEVSRLVTNHPTAFLHPDLSPVLKIRARGENDGILAVAGQVAKGRLFAMGDPSAVMNSMLRYPGNHAFAVGLLKYLVDDDAWGTRKGKVILVEGRFDEGGAYGGESGWLREVRQRVVEELGRIERDGLPKPVLLACAVGAAAGLLLWIASSSARLYHQPLPGFSRPVPLVAQPGAAGRAAVLSAPTTNRSLLFLEQKAALEERVGDLLGLPRPPSPAAILEAIDRSKPFEPPLEVQLRKLLLKMSEAETAVAVGQPLRITTATLKNAEEVTDRVCEVLSSRGRSKENAS